MKFIAGGAILVCLIINIVLIKTSVGDKKAPIFANVYFCLQTLIDIGALAMLFKIL